jgi:eukaryotic-like serine/threonine-protein kinase
MTDAGDKRGPPPPPSRRAEAAAAATIPKVDLIPPSGPLKLVTVVNGSIPDLESSQITKLPDSKRSNRYLGSTIDSRYKVEAVLGEGGMGVVFRCSHTIIGKKVAMKVLRADLARDKEVTERFLNEARSASAIGNPHIIDISDFGMLPDSSAYFVMEFLEGIPLTKIMEGGKPVPVPRIINVARQLAVGLEAAHKAGIVHRDLKPDNIYLVERGAEKDFVKILDFGIAKVTTSAEGRLTKAGAVFGTPHYMSPEQAAGAPVDHRGDIYSFGVILYELASGKVPFDADNFMGILTQHMYKAPVPIRALVPQPQEVPPGLEAIVLKCLSKRPEQRYQSMAEVLADFDKLKAGAIPSAVPEMMNRSGGFNVPADYFKKGAGMPAPMPASPLETGFVRSKWPLIAGIAGVVTAVLGVVIVLMISNSSTASPPPAESQVTAQPEPAPPASTPEAPKQVVKYVAIGIDPGDAHLFQGDKDLGASPVVLEVPEGASVEVTGKREGFKDKTLSFDGSKERASIKLEKIPGARYVPPAKPKKPPEKPVEKPKPVVKPSIGNADVIDPWAGKK